MPDTDTYTPLLKVTNVSKSFGGLQALKDVSFEIGEKQIIGLIGPNGSGKSTAFNVITGYYQPTSGQIYYKGNNIVGKSPDIICRGGLCRTFQIARPFGSMSVLENVMIGALPMSGSIKEAKERAADVLDLVMLSHKADSLGRTLTTLERKRLELARALATQPSLLLLDEVMTGLKPGEMDQILQLLIELKSRMTLLVVEHIMRAIAAISERIIVFDQGKKIADGLPKEVMNSPAVVAAYLGGAKFA